MDMPNNIPGLMILEGNWIKVSGRAPEKIRKLISTGLYPGIVDVMVKVAEDVGGVGDGHKYAASIVIPREKKLDFIDYLNESIKEKIKI